jgi:Fur family ferric uptake transcriptional regulator
MKEYHSQYKDWMMQYFSDHPDELFSAASVYEAMIQEGQQVNQATVYRNLDRLEHDGRIHSHRIHDHDEKYYQYLSPDHHCQTHLHLYCKSCGRVIHLDCAFMDEIREHLENEHGFVLDCTDSTLVGVCSECRKKGYK